MKNLIRRLSRRHGATSRAQELFLRYAERPEDFWEGVRLIQADKLRRHRETWETKLSSTQTDALSQILALATKRGPARPPPVYVTGLGGSGSHWLAGMLGDLPGFVDAQEVYFPDLLRTHMDELTRAEQGYVVDCVHLLHCPPDSEGLGTSAIVNSAAGAWKIPSYRAWDPDAFCIHLMRDPRDQALSTAFRKAGHRERISPGASDDEYLVKRCRLNRGHYRTYSRLRIEPDIECRYEGLRRDTQAEISRILRAIGTQVPDELLQRVLFLHDASNVRAGIIDPRSNLPKTGPAKGWRHDASPNERRIMHAELVESIVQLDYEFCDCFATSVSQGAPVPPERAVVFPESRRGVGELYTSDSEPGTPRRWTRLGTAAGRVILPSGWALLRLGASHPPTSEVFGRLDPDALQSICFAGNRQVDDETLSLLSRLEGTRNFDLARTRVTDRGLAHLKGLPDLEALSLWGTSVSERAASSFQENSPSCVVFGPSPGLSQPPQR